MYGWASQVKEDNIRRRMHMACWITNATDTLKVCNTYCCPTETIVTERSSISVAYPGFFSVGFNKFSWGQTAERVRGSGGGSPLVRVSAQFANDWSPYLITLLWIYFPRNWEFGSALSKLRSFGGEEFEPPPNSPRLVRHCSMILLYVHYLSCW
jgi:hypothetical protein